MKKILSATVAVLAFAATFICAGQNRRSSAAIRCFLVLAGSRYRDDEMSSRQCPACRCASLRWCARRHAPRLLKSICRHIVQTADISPQIRCGSDDVSVVAPGAVKGANIEAGWSAPKARKVHRCTVFWANPARPPAAGESRDEGRAPTSALQRA
jgi:hypothetical protein